MKISLLVNEVSGGWEPTDTRLGGTEESVVQWAKRLHAKGHQVIVYRNGDQDQNYNGVIYVDRNRYAGGSDVTVNIKSSEIAPLEPTLYLTNETDATDKDLSAYDAVIWPSKWAAQNIPVNNRNVLIVPHGYNPEDIYPADKVNKRCLYASSPDRGLEDLAVIWPSVVEAHPDAQLFVTYGGEIDAPNVNCLGSVDEETINELYQTSDFWLHPCTGGELFGITAIKAQAAQCIPVYIPTMALSETVQSGFPVKDTREMLDTLIRIMDNQQVKADVRKKMSRLKLPDWDFSTNELEKCIIRAWKKSKSKQ